MMRQKMGAWESTFTLWLCAAPGAIGLAGPLRGTAERVTGLAAEPHHAANVELISQPNAMRGDPWVTTHTLAASC